MKRVSLVLTLAVAAGFSIQAASAQTLKAIKDRGLVSCGVTGYLEVLTNETNAFSAELELVQAQLNEQLALVQVYQALGGGWQ